MNLNQLEYFVAACEERSITAAARRVSISQQTVSSAVAGLEAELGCALLVRTPKGVYPTRVGEVALGHARAALASVAALRREVAGTRADLASTVAFAYIPEVFLSRSDAFIDQVMETFRQYWPSTRLSPLACQADTCAEAVAEGTYELGFVAQEPTLATLESRVLFECTMDLFVPCEHPLAARDAVSFADLAGIELPPPPNMSHPILDIVKRCQAYGFTPAFVYPAGLGETGPSYFASIVAARRVGFVPQGHVLCAEHGDYRVVPFVDRDAIHLQVRAITKKGRVLSSAAQAFVEFVAMRLQETLERPEA